MKITRNIKVPTGNILVGETKEGEVEFLSIGDYGKEHNIKADFLGLTKEIEHVKHGEMMPLSEKWVITISTQYGCSMGCRFCDVPKVGKGRNVSGYDMLNQIIHAVNIHPEITSTKRLNVHFARMGEPTFNPDVPQVARALKYLDLPVIGESLIHPVVSTMMPVNNSKLCTFLDIWMFVKNDIYNGDAGLQLSINSTSDRERDKMFNYSTLSLQHISGIVRDLSHPKKRKITLNFALADYTINAKKLAKLFSPDKCMVKLTPMHKTATAISNGIETAGDYTTFTPYKETEEALKAEGFDVLVFLASDEEDLGRITCGNAILSGTTPECDYEELIK